MSNLPLDNVRPRVVAGAWHLRGRAARRPASAAAQTPAPRAAPLQRRGRAGQEAPRAEVPGRDDRYVAKSPYFGLYEVMFDEQIVYTDAKVTYVLVGSVYDTATRKNMTEAKMRKLIACRLRQACRSSSR